MTRVKATLPFDYQLRLSPRAKKTRIVVTPQKIEVVAPTNTAAHRIHAFVQAHRDWIVSALQKVTARSEQVSRLAPLYYHDGATVPFKGQQVPLSVRTTNGKRLKVEYCSERGFIVQLPGETDSEQSSERIRAALQKWMSAQARTDCLRYIEHHGARHQLFPGAVRIKTQKSRWGSCGARNDININALLLMAPPRVMEYVVVHELCHIRHKNHSKAFWLLVAEHMPDYAELRRWLKQHGRAVMQGW